MAADITPWQLVAAAVAGAAVGVAATLHVGTAMLKRLTTLLLAHQAARTPATPPGAAGQPAPAAGTGNAGGSDRWVALPGQRLELGATGWTILLNTRPGQPVYWLLTPEGWPVTGAGELALLKQLAERLEAERREFDPTMPDRVRADLQHALAAASARRT